MALSIGSASAAIGEPPEELWTRCESGPSAGQCKWPRGIAASPDSGHVFIAGLGNFRIVEFTAAGGFVKAWGWDVVESGPGNTGVAFEICIPGRGDTCKAGTEGVGAGQFSPALGVAVDSTGGVYVVDFSNRRVQKFDSEGNFVLMFGGNVNQTKVGEGAPEGERNRCPVDPGDVCQAGTTGAGQGEFGSWSLGSFITIDPTDKVYVGDENRIQRFNTEGVYQGEILVPGETVHGLASDSSGNLYATYDLKPDVRKITPGGEELESPRFKISTPEGAPSIPTAVAVDPTGDVYAFGPTGLPGGTKLDPIWKFDSSGNVIANFGKDEFGASTGLATNLCPGNESPGNLYVSNFDFAFNEDFVRAYGTPPTKCGKAITGPATNITETSARLNGEANPKGLAVSECFFEYGTTITYGQSAPCEETAGEIGTGDEPVPVHADISGLDAGTVYHFRLVVGTASGSEEGADATFKTLGPPVISAEHTAGVTDTQATAKALVNPEGLATSCHFEYGTTEAYGQSTEDQPVGGDRKDHAVQATLEGLAPATTYHWQIVCANSSDETEGQDQAFTTFPTAPPKPDTCPNAARRSGAAAFLPDCRAYEMVSPVEKNGGDIIYSGRYAIQVSPDGEKIAYQALSSFAGQPSNIEPNQYLARRDTDSWSSEGNHPPLTGEITPGVQFGYAREYIAFSLDLCSSWLIDYQTPSAASGGQLGYRNLIRRQNCEPGVGDLEALTPEPPALPAGTPDDYVTTESVQGYSEDASHQVFVAKVALPHTPEAAPGTSAQIYDRFEGELSVVSILPSGLADGGGAQVGSGWNANLQNAVSSDGSRVYWTSGAGKIYLRSHPEQGVVAGECTEPSKACTVAVSPTANALFWAASSDGSKAIYSEGNLSAGEAKLYEFEQGAPERREIAKNVYGVLGAAEDLSHVYFASTDAIAGAGPNSEGEEAVAGEPNLYLDQEGTLAFVGTLSEKDLGGTEPGAIAEGYDLVSLSSRQRSTRVSPDGEHMAFQSRAPLTGFDNTDASGKPALEVFTYEAGGELNCVSCNPSGAQPQTEELLPPFVAGWARDPSKTLVRVAAWIPGWERALYDSKVLSDSGGRLFFNSYDALVPRDGNGAMDVYEWEAPGEGSCTSKSPAFHASNGGCIYLISTGESPFESEFWGASPDGEDVFFITESSLVPQDPGLVDLYDARVGGGFPTPEVQVPCEGEACQSPPAPPQFSTPGSSSFNGPGNLAAKPKPRKCPKGKRRVTRKGKSRCVKRKAGKQGKRRRAGAKRRAAR